MHSWLKSRRNGCPVPNALGHVRESLTIYFFKRETLTISCGLGLYLAKNASNHMHFYNDKMNTTICSSRSLSQEWLHIFL